MNIGKAIRELRKEKGLNQTEFAHATGLTQTSLSQIESGAKKPNTGTMKKICDFFGVPEAVIYILATEISDIPQHKQDLYVKMFPNLKLAFLDIFK